MDDVTFGYKTGGIVLRNISFNIDKPGLYCVIGPNGVGKSTLIRCINGISKPLSGQVRIKGIPVEDYKLKDLAKIVGYVPVMSGDSLTMTVLDTVLIGRYSRQKWKTSSEDVLVANKALRAMEISDLAMRNFNELSAGQHQKVSLARGLVQEPEVLVLDEPTANLDVRHQVYVSAFLKKLCEKTGMTVLMISHDLNLAAKFADEVLVLAKPGVLYAMGKPSEVITQQLVEDVYNVNCRVVDDDGSPHVMLHSVRS